jgi:hypothetical protein
MIEFEAVITNGYVDISTIGYMLEKGYTFVCTIPAKNIHPHAVETDKATIFSKYKECECTGEQGKTPANNVQYDNKV